MTAPILHLFSLRAGRPQGRPRDARLPVFRRTLVESGNSVTAPVATPRGANGVRHRAPGAVTDPIIRVLVSQIAHSTSTVVDPETGSVEYQDANVHFWRLDGHWCFAGGRGDPYPRVWNHPDIVAACDAREARDQ